MRDSQGRTGPPSRGRYNAARFAALAAFVILPLMTKAQTVLTDAQAEKMAETLLGKKPDHVDMYFSQKENLEYFAFTASTPGKWDEATKTQTPPQEEIWIYERARGSDEKRLVWKEHQLWPHIDSGATDRYDPLAGFVEVSGQTSPCLRLKAYSGGMHAGTTRLGLYCVAERSLFWVDFFSYFDPGTQTGVQKVQVSDENAAQPQIRRFLLSWGHHLALDVPPSSPSIDAVGRLQQLWIDANGRKACSYEQTPPYRWKIWKTDRIDRLTPYPTRTLLKDPLIVLDDGRYQWLSYPGADAMASLGTALAGVGRYDKQLRRYELVYVPDSSFDYSKSLVLIGDWLYIQDCGERWAVRFNTVNHRLQRGDFDGTVGTLTTGIYPEARPSQAARGQATMLLVGHEFWTTAQDKAFRPGRFPPSIESASRLEFALLKGQGWTCTEGTYGYGCNSGAGLIDMVTSKQDGNQTLEVVVTGTADQTEQAAAALFEVALLLVGRPEWNEAVKPGMAKLLTIRPELPSARAFHFSVCITMTKASTLISLS
ncbi:MAG TPA: hypothetical protein VG028_05080 [Terriglobia bacterium]|nr:hypothetical protein [Terriglobia bacterium]